jgi:hypothetical protein
MKEEEKENNGKTARIITASIISFTILVIGLLISNTASATINSDSVCLIIVSGCEGYSDNELVKASSFFNCLNQTLDRDDIYYLTATSESGSQGPANISNVENSFQWLQNNCEPSDEVIIYISDHAKRSFNDTYFSFNDGNISADTIDSWIDEIDCIHTTVIINGEKSGLGGIDLQDSSRDIICSMEDDQEYDPDLFNITRSLEDPASDTNNDEIVDFIEAFWRENYLLTGTGQDPVLYQ